jgi:arabinose-5-phosphate isomerase
MVESLDVIKLISPTDLVRVAEENLADLRHHFPENWEDAVKLLLACTGKIVISAVGKSGFVGRLWSSLLSSTGSPSFFLHPIEAAHGDLGGLSSGDVLVLISASGESAELFPLPTYASQKKVPVIALTSDPASTLAKEAEFPLLLPKTRGFCPLGVSPSSVNIVMVTFCHVLTFEVMKRRELTLNEYRNAHPAGHIGYQLMDVNQVMMQNNLPLVGEDSPLSEGILVMTRGGMGALGVVNPQGQLIGIVTDGDLRRHMGPQLLSKRARDVMTVDPFVLDRKALLKDAITLFNEHKITGAFVVDKDKVPQGFLHLHDCLRQETDD